MSRRSNFLSQDLPDGLRGDDAREAVFQHPWMMGPVGRWTGLVRIANVLGALALMVFLAPLVAVVWLYLRVRQGSGVLTRERRLGLHSVVFHQWVFRVAAGGQSTGTLPAASGLQNLPALLNVLAGDMAILGPPPVCPAFARKEAARDPFYTSRFAVKPGLLALDQ